MKTKKVKIAPKIFIFSFLVILGCQLTILYSNKDENVHRYEVTVKLLVKKDQRCIFRLAVN